MSIKSSLLTVDTGKRFVRYVGYMPRPLVKRALFGTAVLRAIRASKPAVWRPLAEAALGDALVVKISPKRIAGIMPYTLAFGGEPTETRWWFVLPGDWDINPTHLADHETYPRMRDLLSGDLRQSATYKELTALQLEGKLPDRIKKLGRTKKMGRKIGTVDGYFDYYRALADKIAEGRSIPNFGPSDGDRYVGVAIGRDGQIIQHQKGHHRAIIAQFVPCDAMEARVLAVHPLWVKKLSSRLAFADAITDGIALLSVQ